MQKEQRLAILNHCKKLEGQQSKKGTGSIYGLGSKKANLNIPRWSTGIEDLDHILGGGMPEGRIIEISGPESSGKTSLVLWLCSFHEMALYNVPEGTFDASRAKVLGNRPKQLLVYRPEYGEDALDRVNEFVNLQVPLIAIDSVPALLPKEDYDKVEKSLENEHRIGGVARLLNKELPVLQRNIEKSKSTVIFVNQVRDKMGAMMFGEKTDTPGRLLPLM